MKLFNLIQSTHNAVTRTTSLVEHVAFTKLEDDAPTSLAAKIAIASVLLQPLMSLDNAIHGARLKLSLMYRTDYYYRVAMHSIPRLFKLIKLNEPEESIQNARDQAREDLFALLVAINFPGWTKNKQIKLISEQIPKSLKRRGATDEDAADYWALLET